MNGIKELQDIPVLLFKYLEIPIDNSENFLANITKQFSSEFSRDEFETFTNLLKKLKKTKKISILQHRGQEINTDFANTLFTLGI